MLHPSLIRFPLKREIFVDVFLDFNTPFYYPFHFGINVTLSAMKFIFAKINHSKVEMRSSISMSCNISSIMPGFIRILPLHTL